MVDVNISKEMLRSMHNDMVDSSNIASSAIALAANRSADLNIPVQITLITLKILIEINIARDIKRRKLPEAAVAIAKLMGIEPPKVAEVALNEVEKLIRAWIDQAKFEEVEIGQ